MIFGYFDPEPQNPQHWWVGSDGQSAPKRELTALLEDS